MSVGVRVSEGTDGMIWLGARAETPLEEGEPPVAAVGSPSSSGAPTPEPAGLRGPSGGSHSGAAATPAPIRKDGATAGSGAPLHLVTEAPTDPTEARATTRATAAEELAQALEHLAAAARLWGAAE